jgi:hypothetical protein
LPLWRALQVASDSDTIHLRLVYLHRPMQEWLRILLQALSQEQHGLIPLVVDFRVLRQHSLTGKPQRKALSMTRSTHSRLSTRGGFDSRLD